MSFRKTKEKGEKKELQRQMKYEKCRGTNRNKCSIYHCPAPFFYNSYVSEIHTVTQKRFILLFFLKGKGALVEEDNISFAH